MKILLLTQVLPYPPDSGPKVKTWNVLKYLAERHDVTLVSFVRGDQRADLEQLQPYCHAIYPVPIQRAAWRDALALGRSLVSRQPWVVARDDQPAMRELVEWLTTHETFDIAHADQLNMLQYARLARGAAVVLDAHNALWVLYRRLADTLRFNPMKLIYARDWQLLKTYEGEACRAADGVLAVSPEDRAALAEAAGQPLDITTVPIAIDTRETQPVTRSPQAGKYVHIGTMFWLPNVDGILWFAREVLPRIRAKRPQVTFDVIGARPPRSITSLQGDGINVTGFVPDPTPYLQNAGVMVVPLRAGGGMRVKIINALAQGLPVVSTRIGAEGIDVVDGEHLLLADTPDDFAAAVLRLLDEPALAQRLSSGGRALAESCYDYRVACAPIDGLYETALQRYNAKTTEI
jgi:glycosyltransferase involved in cell wall biosynthesis